MLGGAVCAQPAGYYAPASFLNGQPLRIALMQIIRSHTALTYTPGLWNAYHTTDVRPDGKLWDVYSDKPGATPAYEYTIGTNQCSGSSPSAEGGCYNREHTWPQSKFGSTAPMQTDLFIVYPTDYYVNSNRGDLPYGKVGSVSQTFTNGSKIGSNIYPGAPSGSCYEPIDSFKGDLARNYFYVSTCYRNDSSVFVTWEMATQVNLKGWTAQMLLDWHHNDPVSKKEIDRNNAVYALQGNRNPFIDHPEYADCIWGTGDCSMLGVLGLNAGVPGFKAWASGGDLDIAWNTPLRSDAVLRLVDATGRLVRQETVPAGTGEAVLSAAGLGHGLYVLLCIMPEGVSAQKIML